MTVLDPRPGGRESMRAEPIAIRGVCAVGASAGGLEALERFFAAVPAGTGIAYVVIQHLSPDYRSLMAELLARHTALPVKRAEDGMRLEPDTIYLNPPKSDLTLDGVVLRLREHVTLGGLHLPIDTFFASMGAALGERSAGVVLSGTGSDGTRGARELKAEGGFVLAQDPSEAQFDGMPRSVQNSGLADQVLPAGEMPQVVVQFLSRNDATAITGSAESLGPADAEHVQRVLVLLREQAGVDFSGYKPSTIYRRIERRVQMHPGLDLERYTALLRESPSELRQLHRDLLINVTRFFRDAEAFAILESTVIPQVLRDAPRDREVRVWVPACSTGEEPYSIAMLLLEALSAAGDSRELRVFATDVDDEAIDVAAHGLYPESIAADLTPERLARFFSREGDGYRVTRALRERVIFARHNILRDPPLTRMDIVSCRNFLIYLGTDQQRKVLALLAYALRARGFLFLGPSESVGQLASHFQVVDHKWRILQALNPGRQTLVESFPSRGRRSSGVPVVDGFAGGSAPRAWGTRLPGEELLLDRVYQELSSALGMRCVVLDAEYHLVHAFGNVGDLLHVSPGRSTLEIFKLLPKPLAAALRTALGRAMRESEVAYRGIDAGPGRPSITLRVRPIEMGGERIRLYLAFFQDGPEPFAGESTESMATDGASAARIAQLEQELQYTKEHLQATIEELETSNEELQATNEELVASNEELQSTNEELQSVNEELQTVNAEHQEKILELIGLNNDIENLLRSTGVGIVFLDREARIRKFTEAATRLLHVMPHDIGRPIAHIAAKLPGLDLEAMSRRVMHSGASESLEVVLPDGSLSHLRVLPYLVREGPSDGTILSLVDITEVKRGELRLQSILDALPASVAVVTVDGTITQTNAAWSRFAERNDAPEPLRAGVGLNYLHVTQAAANDPTATAAARGIREVLDGVSPAFRLEYPCHSPTEKRWFQMEVHRIEYDGLVGAVIQHLDISNSRLRLDEYDAWRAAVLSIPNPALRAVLPPPPADR